MQIYSLHGNLAYMVYWFKDETLGWHLMGRKAGHVILPTPEMLPLKMSPSFGDEKIQPTKLGDFHTFSGTRRLFSERAVETLSLDQSGSLFPVELEGRAEKFFWYWSTTIIDCLDEKNSKRLMSTLDRPAFFEEKIGNAEIFTIPQDQKFQHDLFVTESFLDKIKKGKLKGFALHTSYFDPKPWKS